MSDLCDMEFDWSSDSLWVRHKTSHVWCYTFKYIITLEELTLYNIALGLFSFKGSVSWVLPNASMYCIQWIMYSRFNSLSSYTEG